MRDGLLVIVPCGQKKIWGRDPHAGPTPARDAYEGSPFVVNRSFAEHFGESWVILSAKYGFIEPTFTISGPYNITFKRKATNPVPSETLREQRSNLQLDRFRDVIGLGGKEYRAAIEDAFQGSSARLHFPFAGLPIGKMMQAIKRSVDANSPFGCAQGSIAVRPPTTTPELKTKSRLMSTNADATKETGEACDRLHRWFNSLPAFQFPFDAKKIPRNGVYLLFEVGEVAHGGNRIVRIGSHTGDNQLHSRLLEHFTTENKDRSIFRKNIGRCLLNRDGDPFLEMWERDLTTREAKNKFGHLIDFEKQKRIEKSVSAYMREHFRFVVLEIPDKVERLMLESKLVSTVSLCSACAPAQNWLGRYSPKAKIRESGLWQVNELYKTPLSAEELDTLEKKWNPNHFLNSLKLT